MLRQYGAREPFAGLLVEHECPRCGSEVELPLGEICGSCWSEIERRAGKLARLVAISTTLGLAAYVYLRMPPDATSRLVGLSAIVAWYIITGLVTKRIVREVLK